MTKRFITTLAVLVAMGMGGTGRAAAPSAFEWMRPLEGAFTNGQLFRLEVPADVFARAHAFPNDLRILDAEDRQWPFFLAPPPARTEIRVIGTESINSAWVEGADPYLRIDMHVQTSPVGQPRPRYNRATLKATGRDFIRRVEVFGSEDQSAWALLGKGYLIDVNEPRRMTEDTIHFGLSDYPFVQVRIFPNARNAMETFTAARAELRADQGLEPATRIIPHRIIAVPAAEQKPEAQSLILDLEHDKQPVEVLRLRAGDGGDYVRRAVVYARNDPGEPWRYAGAGDIHRIGASIKDHVPVRGVGRYLKCEVYHYDDPPLALDVIDVVSTRRFLIGQAMGASPAILYYGGAFVDSPRYDLMARVEKIGPDVAVVVLGEPLANPAFRPGGFGGWGPALGVVAVGLASLAVLVVIVRMFKRVPPGS